MTLETPPPKSLRHPLAGYVSLVTYLQSERPEPDIEALITQELTGKRRDYLLYTLVTRLFLIRKQQYLKSIGVPPNGKRIFA